MYQSFFFFENIVRTIFSRVQWGILWELSLFFSIFTTSPKFLNSSWSFSFPNHHHPDRAWIKIINPYQTIRRDHPQVVSPEKTYSFKTSGTGVTTIYFITTLELKKMLLPNLLRKPSSYPISMEYMSWNGGIYIEPGWSVGQSCSKSDQTEGKTARWPTPSKNDCTLPNLSYAVHNSPHLQPPSFSFFLIVFSYLARPPHFEQLEKKTK